MLNKDVPKSYVLLLLEFVAFLLLWRYKAFHLMQVYFVTDPPSSLFLCQKFGMSVVDEK